MKTYATSAIAAYRSELVVQLRSQSHALVGHRKRKRLTIAIQARICHQLELLKQAQCPKRRHIRSELGLRRAPLHRDDGCSGSADPGREVFLSQLASQARKTNTRAQPHQRLS